MIKSTKIHILDGPFTDEWSIKPVNGGLTYVEPVTGFVWDYTWEYAEVESLQFLYENISGGGMSYSPGWGFLGAEAFGAAGLALGAKRDKIFRIIYFVCILKDGRKFTACASADCWDEWRRLIAKPYSPPRQKETPPPPKNIKDVFAMVNAYIHSIYCGSLTIDKVAMGCVVIPICAFFVVAAIFHFLGIT